MTKTHDVQGPIVDSSVIGDEAITTTISQVKDAWSRGAKDRLKLGELFSQLRSQVEAYRTNEKTGLTYNQAVSKTGVPRGTAERYREMYETVESSGIKADIFLALAEHRCNLAAERSVTASGILRDLRGLNSLDITDEDAVKKMAAKINQEYPLNPSDKRPASPVEELETLLGNLEGMPKTLATEKMIAETRSEIGKVQQSSLLILATALAPFIGKERQWAEQYVDNVAKNSALLKQRYAEAVKFAKSAAFLSENK